MKIDFSIGPPVSHLFHESRGLQQLFLDIIFLFFFPVPAAKMREAIYDFSGDQGGNQLTFKVGDIITVVRDPDTSGWCWGRTNHDGAQGYFPFNYTKAALAPPSLPGIIDPTPPVTTPSVSPEANVISMVGRDPGDWKKSTDVEGNVIFYSKSTKQVRFSPPPDFLEAAVAEALSLADLSLCNHSAAENEGSCENSISLVALASPGGIIDQEGGIPQVGNVSTEIIKDLWESVVDSSSGRVYYVNRSSGAVQWEKPVTLLCQAAASVPIVVRPSEALPGVPVALPETASRMGVGPVWSASAALAAASAGGGALAAEAEVAGFVSRLRRAIVGAGMDKKRGSQKNYDRRHFFVKEDLTEVCWAKNASKKSSASTLPVSQVCYEPLCSLHFFRVYAYRVALSHLTCVCFF
jgi:hypothetical protein